MGEGRKQAQAALRFEVSGVGGAVTGPGGALSEPFGASDRSIKGADDPLAAP